MDDHMGRGGADEHLDAETLDAYVTRADELAPAARAAVDAHLAACVDCRAALRDLEATIGLLRALPQVAPRRTFILTPELVAPARTPERRAPRRLPWVWPARWATALVTLLLALTVGLDLGGVGGAATPGAASARAGNEATLAALVTVPPRAAQPLTGLTTGDTAPTPTTAPGEQPVRALGLTPVYVFPTPTAVPATVAPAAGPAAPDWRIAEIGLAALALALGCAGFLAPPFLRRDAEAEA
ncbi:MAG TPA: hypothetical protein VFW96_11340 [Thermomicrobiales bacterium]|nr:hypothetical protein [Thermomicrobiales bacterium]